ncbi:immunoglobulin kappa light chain-like [Podarcis lilfordi]|nr:immunoglobulin kappa light chain-like [Podarcis lilfordi]
MPLTAYLFLFSAVFPAHLQILHPTQRFLFVDIGETAQISCTSVEDIENQALSFSWYKRREHGMPILIKSCDVRKPGGRFACKVNPNRRNAILEILHVQSSDSGQYLCAQASSSGLHFSNATSSLIVGDSYTPSTWVMLLQPSNQDPASRFKNQLVCVVHGVSNFVQVSWDVPGGLQQEDQTFLAKNSSGLLTFLSVFRLPMELQNTGGNITCEVMFSSRTIVKKSSVFNAYAEIPQCHFIYTWVLDTLTLLLLPLNFLWIRFYPSDS